MRAVLRVAAPMPLAVSDVRTCLDLEGERDRLFVTALERSLDAIPAAQRRGALAGVTGHVAESVVELVLGEQYGFHPVWHFTGPGRHGVDLLMLTPDA